VAFGAIGDDTLDFGAEAFADGVVVFVEVVGVLAGALGALDSFVELPAKHLVHFSRKQPTPLLVTPDKFQ
jgi:hypothetical protein